MLTKREAAIVSAYTGYLIGKFGKLHEYVEEIMERPVFTHETSNPIICDEIREKSRKDFISIRVKD